MARVGVKSNIMIKFNEMGQSASSRPRLQHNSKKDIKAIGRQVADYINLLKPTGHVMHQQV